MSRSSSVSTKDRAGLSKKSKPAKQRREDNESFDKRSEYTTFFPPQQMPSWVPGAQYPQMVPQAFNGNVQGNFPPPMPPQFSSPNPHFNPSMMGNPAMQYNMPQVRLKSRLTREPVKLTSAVSPTAPSPFPKSQCADYHVWLTCSIPTGSTAAVATAATQYVSTSVSTSEANDGRTSKHNPICFWSIAQHCEPGRSKEPASNSWKLQSTGL